MKDKEKWQLRETVSWKLQTLQNKTKFYSNNFRLYLFYSRRKSFMMKRCHYASQSLFSKFRIYNKKELLVQPPACILRCLQLHLFSTDTHGSGHTSSQQTLWADLFLSTDTLCVLQYQQTLMADLYSKYCIWNKKIKTVPGRFDSAVTVIMLSPGVSGASRHLGFASESSLRSSRILLDPNILSG